MTYLVYPMPVESTAPYAPLGVDPRAIAFLPQRIFTARHSLKGLTPHGGTP